MAMTPEQLLLLQEELRKKKEAEMAGAPESVAPEENALDSIITRKQRPDPLAPYDERIQAATNATPNMGQMIGAGFAGLGQAMAGGQGGYLDKTLAGIEAGRQRNITGANLAKTQFEESGERDANSEISREFQLTAAEMTGRKPEDLASMSAYDIKKVLPTLESRYKVKVRSEEKEALDKYRADTLLRSEKEGVMDRNLKRELAISEEKTRAAKAKEPDNFIKREIAKARVKAAELGPVAESTKTEIDKLLKLNENSFSGTLGEWQMAARRATGLGDESTKFENTAEIVNTMRGQVAKILKATFGGAISDSERTFMENLMGALPGLSKKERDIAMRRVQKTMADAYAAGQNVLYELTQDFEPGNIEQPDQNIAQPNQNAVSGTGPHGNRVKQNGKVYVWDGTQYVEEK